MTPIWASKSLLPPGSIAPIAEFAPAGSMYTIRKLNPIRAQQPIHSDRQPLTQRG